MKTVASGFLIRAVQRMRGGEHRGRVARSLTAAALGMWVMAGTAVPSQAKCLVDGTPADAGTDGDNTVLCTAENTPAGGAAFDAAGGDDAVTLSTGASFGSLTLGTGADELTMAGGTLSADLMLGESPTSVATDADDFSMTGGTVAGTVFGSSGVDTVGLSGTARAANLLLLGGADVFTLSDTARVTGNTGVALGAGNDTARLLGGSVRLNVDGGAGSDDILLDGARVEQAIIGGDDADTVTLTSGSVGSVSFGTGNDAGSLANAFVAGSITFGAGADSFTMTGGTVGRDLILGNTSNPSTNDQDSVTMTGGTVTGIIYGDGGIDTVALSGSADVGSVMLFGGNDILTLSGGAVVREAGGVSLGAGNDAVTLDGAAVTGAVSAGEGDDLLIWLAGTMSSFHGDNGADTAAVSAAEYDGTLLLDGGGGMGRDRLFFEGLQFNADPTTTLTGWEEVHLTQGSIAGMAGTLDTGLLNIAAGSTLRVLDSGLGTGTAGDALVVTGSFGGGGTVILEAALAGSPQLADHLVIGGDVTGQTRLVVNNLTSGLGKATTGDGILLVDVGGAAEAGSFVLAGPILVGAFEYELDFGGAAGGNRNFYLVSSVVDSLGALYEGAPHVLAEDFARLPGLIQRYAGRMPASRTGALDAGGTMPVFASAGPWLQIEGGRGNVEAENGDRYGSDRVSVKLGFDAAGDFENGGHALVGGYLRHARSDADIDNRLGDSSLTPEGYGLGVTALYLAGQGSYLDLQASVMRVESEMEAGGPAPAEADVVAFATAASAELGHVFDVGAFGRLIPGAQFQMGDVSAPDFRDSLGFLIEGFGGTSRTGLLHLAWQSPEPGSSPLPRLSARLGYEHEFISVQRVKVDGEERKTRLPDDWVEAELGLDWAVGEASGFNLRASYAAAVGEDPTHNHGLEASVSFRAAF